MTNKILNVTCGEYFNEYFLSRFGGEAVPLCEAMMDGDAVLEIYSESFVSLRAKALGVSTKEYRAKMQLVDALNNNDYTTLSLWFGRDTFCQANLLMLLAYLEQIKFGGGVVLNYVDDESFAVLETDIEVALGEYKKRYEELFVERKKPRSLGVLVPQAIELYFDYHSDEGYLADLIRKNLRLDRTALICLLLENSKDYGLSDLQAAKLIERYR